jgi:hypothetical protein
MSMVFDPIRWDRWSPNSSGHVRAAFKIEEARGGKWIWHKRRDTVVAPLPFGRALLACADGAY